MGVVYRAKHLHLDRTVALKVLTAELAANPDFRERFLRESRTAASIQHPSIVTIYDAGEADGLLYIAMQYVEETDLGELIEQEGALEPERAVAFLAQIAGALDAAHAHGVVHRDVKPANVLVQSDRCYLTDFGLTKPLSASQPADRTGRVRGHGPLHGAGADRGSGCRRADRRVCARLPRVPRTRRSRAVRAGLRGLGRLRAPAGPPAAADHHAAGPPDGVRRRPGPGPGQASGGPPEQLWRARRRAAGGAGGLRRRARSYR